MPKRQTQAEKAQKLLSDVFEESLICRGRLDVSNIEEDRILAYAVIRNAWNVRIAEIRDAKVLLTQLEKEARDV